MEYCRQCRKDVRDREVDSCRKRDCPLKGVDNGSSDDAFSIVDAVVDVALIISDD
jgi:hypothetical protein